MNEKINLLVVDDEENILWVLKEGLDGENISVLTASNGDDAFRILSDGNIDVCLVDVFLNEQNGIQLVEEWSKVFHNIHFVIITAQNTSSNVIGAMKAGAIDFFQKPFNLVELQEKLLSYSSAKHSKPSRPEEFIYDFQSNNPKMIDIYKLIGRIAKTNINVLIQGETGTGKEVIAHMIHEKSNRSNNKFVAINMAAIPKELVESELFGHVKGAFTGAVSDKAGKFEEANGGTIFLDEISELDLSLQSKLLRILQEKELNRIGANKTIKLDIRVIAATNKNLEKTVREEKFREDLYYRLNVVTIDLPALRERKEDLRLLITHFLNKYADIKGEVLSLGEDAFKIMHKYNWPGNIRELENVVQYSIVQANSSVISPVELPDKLRFDNSSSSQNNDSLSTQLYELAKSIIDSESLTGNFTAYDEFTNISEKPLIIAALNKANWNKSLAAKLLGINRNTLRKKMSSMKIE